MMCKKSPPVVHEEKTKKGTIEKRVIRCKFRGKDIEVEKDFKEAKGYCGTKTETNSMLASRDYNIECDTSCEPLMVVEGFWIWWCKTHLQPLYCCEREIEKINNKIDRDEMIMELFEKESEKHGKE